MLTSKLSWIPVSSTGMTGEGGYLDDTIFFLDPSSQGTEMTGERGTGMTKRVLG
ncbi:hypothetical protein [Wolbachia endosymbiont (group A) of Bombylius major]|uniref:hypothetical protein n=1 Tax=Wolbachia endosymbiont (group A) of Bombylius major TaxID=2953988 RepID=UPI0022306DBE|nr:hypothetical protein [Wolbachia endosymbiont (group A) of Bombylius major]